MPGLASADNSAVEYTSLLLLRCTSGQYWPSSEGRFYRALSRWVFAGAPALTASRDKAYRPHRVNYADRARRPRQRDSLTDTTVTRRRTYNKLPHLTNYFRLDNQHTQHKTTSLRKKTSAKESLSTHRHLYKYTSSHVQFQFVVLGLS